MHANITISIIATFHDEGMIAHKTVSNIKDLVAPLKTANITYEIIFHIDNGDRDTINIVNSYKDPTVRVYQNNFGDPASSRNYAIQKSKGKYVVLLDGDDITSPNWIIDGYNIIKRSEKDIILHTETDITFGIHEKPRIWKMRDSYNDYEDWLILFGRNRWSAGTILSKEIALKYPYRNSTAGFGFEDWTFNIDTRNSGIKHQIVPHSVRFVRIKTNSVYKSHLSNNTVTRFSNSYDYANTKAILKSGITDKQIISPFLKSPLSTKQKIIKYSYKALLHTPILDKLTAARLNRVDQRIINNRKKKLSRHIFDAYKYANRLDNNIFLDDEKIRNMITYTSEYSYLGMAYCQMVAQLHRKPDYVFLVPQLSIGGTEKVIVNYITALKKIKPEWHIAVLSSLPAQNPYKLPDNVDFIDFYNITKRLTNFEKDFLVSRFIIEMNISSIHVVHDYDMYQWIINHKELIRNRYDVYATHFMYEYTPNIDYRIGFADPYLEEIYPLIRKVFTDNSQTAKDLIENHHFLPEKVSVHYQPIEIPPRKHAEIPTDGKFKILWASRVSEQKRPDILKEIGKRLDSNIFEIHVFGRCQSPYKSNYFKGVKSIHYHGPYNGFNELNTNEYDMALYTSQTDGLPNTILEMTLAGLPIVSSDTGGIRDAISESIYLSDVDNIDGYVESIRWVKDNYKKAILDARNRQKKIMGRHAEDNLIKQIQKDLN